MSAAGLAPDVRAISRPPAKTASVGIDRMPNARRDRASASVFTFTTSNLPALRPATFASSGATIRQGPHHGRPVVHDDRDRCACDTRRSKSAELDFERLGRRRELLPAFPHRTASPAARTPGGSSGRSRARHEHAAIVESQDSPSDSARNLPTSELPDCRRPVPTLPCDASAEQRDAERVGVRAVVRRGARRSSRTRETARDDPDTSDAC